MVIGLFSLKGALRGFFRGAFGLLGWGGGVAAALLFWNAAGRALAQRWGLGSALAYVIAFALLFLGPYVGLHFVGGALQRVSRSIRLGGIDRLAGAALGGVTGALVAGAGLSLISATKWGESLVGRSSVAKPLIMAFRQAARSAGL